MTDLKKRMVAEMFNRIKRGPARDDMEIKSKKSKKTIEVFHWHNTRNFKYDYCVLYHDFDYTDEHPFGVHKIIAEFPRWSDAFKFVADYVLENNF